MRAKLKSLLIFSCQLGLVHPSQGNLGDEVDNLNPTHYGEAGEEAECTADHRDLGHCGGLGVLGVDVEYGEAGEEADLGDMVKGGAVEVDVNNLELHLRDPAWQIIEADIAVKQYQPST